MEVAEAFLHNGWDITDDLPFAIREAYAVILIDDEDSDIDDELRSWRDGSNLLKKSSPPSATGLTLDPDGEKLLPEVECRRLKRMKLYPGEEGWKKLKAVMKVTLITIGYGEQCSDMVDSWYQAVRENYGESKKVRVMSIEHSGRTDTLTSEDRGVLRLD